MMARRSVSRRGVIRASALIACAAVSVIGVRAGLALVTSLPSFAAPTSLDTGLAPVSVAIGDLNGDAKPDVATANRLSGTVSVFLNYGFGAFAPRRDYSTSALPSSLAIGDVNGDGRPDLVTSNSRDGDESVGTVSVLTNSGDGSFAAKRDYPTGMSPYSVAIGDLDGDGNPDLAVAIRNDDVSGSGAVSVLTNNGDGAFVARRAYPLEADPAAVAIGDLNGDGRADVVTANTYAGTLSVLLNNGAGGFGARRDYATGDWAPSVAIGDLNADGRAELVAGHFGRMVSVFFNRGDGTFEAPREHETGRYPNAVAIVDLNGDGAPDLATANYQSNTVSVLANWGDGSFVARRDFRTGEDPWSIAAGDVNGDGKPDLATVSEYRDGVSLLTNTTGLCTVPKVRLKTVPAAKRAITHGLCRFGGIRRAYSAVIAKGRVLSAAPKPGTVLPAGGKVNLLVSRGRRR
jgi:FG-GAP-like repeat/PASTA domain